MAQCPTTWSERVMAIERQTAVYKAPCARILASTPVTDGVPPVRATATHDGGAWPERAIFGNFEILPSIQPMKDCRTAGGTSPGATAAAALEMTKEPELPGGHILVVLPSTAEHVLSTPLFAVDRA
jgi:hypothetical protein